MSERNPNTMMDQPFWEDIFLSRTEEWGGDPNSQLVRECSALTPGRALDAATGEGTDAMWLAGRGWQVTAVDISTVALRRNAAVAERAGSAMSQRIQWQQADLTKWTPPESAYDLVSAHFLHLPPAEREFAFRGLAAAVAPSGTLLIVGHHTSDLNTTIGRWRAAPDLLFTAEEVATQLEPDRWQIVVCAAHERNAIDPEGRTVIINDAVLRATRL